MALVLDGTNGVSGVDGTASNPSLEGTDSNTGVFFPAADTVAIGTGGTEALRVNSSQNVGIGTQSPAVKLDVAGNATIQNGVLTVGKDTLYDAFINTPESMYFNVDSDGNSTNNKFVWGTDRASNTGGTTWMTLDASGNLGIGTTTLNQKLNIYGDGTNYSALINFDRGGVYTAQIGTDGAGAIFGSTSNHLTRFITNNTERARITSGGGFLVGSTTTYGSASSTGYFSSISGGGTGTQVVAVWNANNYSSGSQYLMSFGIGASYTEKGYIVWNGTSVAITQVSDQRLKENIVDAPSALQKINSIKIRSFDLKENNAHVDFGVVAQELNEIAPEATFEGVNNEDGSIDKPWTVDTSILVPAMIKAMQEQQAMIDELKAKVAALENA